MTIQKDNLNPIHARSRARVAAMQALYQWQMNEINPNDIKEQFLIEQDLSRADLPYFDQLINGVPRIVEEIDSLLLPHLERTVKEVDPIERAILRLAVYELKTCIEIPYKVVISEAVRISKKFGSTDAFKYVNAVLDGMAKELRSLEVNANK